MTSNLLAALKSNQVKANAIPVNPLIEAARHGQLENCERALQEPKIKVDTKDEDGMSPLMHAAVGGFLDVLKLLAVKGARIGAKDDLGETALMKACKEGQIEVYQFLLDHALTQRKPRGGGVLQQDAAGAMQLEKRRLLDAKDDEGVTALMKACEAGEIQVVRSLIEEGAGLDVKDDEGWNCLVWAALGGQLEICEMIVKDFGMAADIVSEKGDSPLMKAAANGFTDVAEFCIAEGAKVNQHDEDYQTPLMWAASEGHLDTVRCLVEREAKIDVQTKLGKTALLLAAQFGCEEVCKYLVDKGAAVDHVDGDGATALMAAIVAGHRSLCAMLLTAKCPIEGHTKRGETALMWAAQNQQLECVKVVLAHGANIHTQDENGQTALDHAEGTLNSHVVEILREALRRDPRAPDA